MKRVIVPHVVLLVALVAAVGGGAYALTIPPNSVGTAQLKDDAVTKAKIHANAVTGAKVADASLTKRDIKLSSLPFLSKAITFNRRVSVGAPTVTLIQTNSFRLRGKCLALAEDESQLWLQSLEDDSIAHANWYPSSDRDFDLGEELLVTFATAGDPGLWEAQSFWAQAPSGSAMMGMASAAGGVFGSKCVFQGYAVPLD